MAYTFSFIPVGTRFSEGGDNYTKVSKKTARRDSDGEIFTFDPDMELSIDGEIPDGYEPPDDEDDEDDDDEDE